MKHENFPAKGDILSEREGGQLRAASMGDVIARAWDPGLVSLISRRPLSRNQGGQVLRLVPVTDTRGHQGETVVLSSGHGGGSE